jgi:hypothetical protein
MTYSPIFNEYARIAQEQGLISKAEVDKDKVGSSLTWEAYDFKQEEDLLDKAHPETVVLFDAYDPMNGIVENLKERSKIMKYIALKTPRMIQTNTIYLNAREDLFNETIKLALFLDSQNDVQLAQLADSCTEQLTKEAGAPLVIGLALLAAAAIGLFYANNHPAAQGLRHDLDKAIGESKEAITGWASGYKELSGVLNPFISSMEDLKGWVDSFNSKMDDIQRQLVELKLNTLTPEEKAKKVVAFTQKVFQSGKDKELQDLAHKIKISEHNILEAMPIVLKELEEAPTKHPEEHWYTNQGSWANYLGKAYYWLASTDTEDASDAIQLLGEDIRKFDDYMENFLKQLDSVKSELNNTSGSFDLSSPSNTSTHPSADVYIA